MKNSNMNEELRLLSNLLKVAGNEKVEFSPEAIKRMEDSKVIKPEHIDSVYQTLSQGSTNFTVILICFLVFAIIFILLYIFIKLEIIKI